jgi:predicted membrane protein
MHHFMDRHFFDFNECIILLAGIFCIQRMHYFIGGQFFSFNECIILWGGIFLHSMSALFYWQAIFLLVHYPLPMIPNPVTASDHRPHIRHCERP